VDKVAVPLGKSRNAILPATIEKIKKQFGDDPSRMVMGCEVKRGGCAW
jgi:hypothetical protein